MDLAKFRAFFDQQLASRFDSDPRKLLVYGVDDKAAATLVADAMRTKGKRIRPYLLHRWSRELVRNIDTLEAELLVELVHTATLVIDDVQDKSDERRGAPSFHAVHGEPLAINTGTLMLFMACTAARELPPGADELVVDTVRELFLGQGSDVLWENKHTKVDLEAYRAMCVRKTGRMFSLVTSLAELLATGKIRPHIAQLAEDYGVLFQYVDDLSDAEEDAKIHKLTAVSLVGEQNVRHEVQKLQQTILQQLEDLGAAERAVFAEITKLLASKAPD